MDCLLVDSFTCLSFFWEQKFAFIEGNLMNIHLPFTARYHYDRVPPPTPGLYSDYQVPESSCPSPISTYFSPPPPPSPQRL